MGINEIIIFIMVIFMVIGGIDKCLGNKFGYGEKFEEGFMAMGALALAMVGVISLAPVLAKVLRENKTEMIISDFIHTSLIKLQSENSWKILPKWG